MARPILAVTLLMAALMLSSCMADSSSSTNECPPLGHNMLANFTFAPGYVNLNHGSYGAPSKSVLEAQRHYRESMDEKPDKWFRYEMYDAVDRAREKLAKYIHANASDVVFVENASHGVNAVLRSLIFPAKRPKTLLLNLAYQMVKNTASFIERGRQQDVVYANVTFPTTADAIVKTVEAVLKEHGQDIYVASFSHITSTPAIILPIKELIKVCHDYGLLVLIDGAHALGHIPIDVPSYGADFYVSNAHKWLYAPKGSAFLWVDPKHQDMIWPTTISMEGQGATRYQVAFSYLGTLDQSPFLCVSDCLAFRSAIGEECITSYIHDLAVQGGHLLAKRWNTSLLVDDAMIGAMVNVEFPLQSEKAGSIPEQLLDRFNTWVPVFPVGNIWYTRVSAQIYNELQDFEYLAKAVEELIKDMK